MKSIAFINNYFPSFSATFIYREVIGLKRRGLPISTFSIRKPPRDSISAESVDLMDSTTYLLPVRPWAFILSHLAFIVSKPGRYFRTALFLLTRKFDHFFKDRIRTFFHFCEGVYFAKIISKDANIVHIHAHYASHPCTVAYVASRLTGKPFSFTAHAHDIWEDKLFISEKVNAAKFIMTCTKYGKQSILNMGKIENPAKITAVYHGIDINKFQFTPGLHNRNCVRILTVGRLVRDKAQINLIKACDILKRNGYIFECIIVGDGTLQNALQSEVERLGLSSAVRFVGRVFQQDILEYYARADIFVLSSIQENLPNVLLESMAMGVPVVATKIAGVPELIKHKFNGILVEPGDPEQIASGIKALIDDRELALDLARNARKWVCENFDFEKSLDQLKTIYDSALQGI